MKVKKALGTAIVILGVLLIAFSIMLKGMMFSFSSIDKSESVTIYAYTLNEEKTKMAAENLFSGVFAIAKSNAENLEAKDISAIHAKVYLSGPDYVENDERSFLDRFYKLYLLTIGAIVVIIGINLLSEKIDE